MSVCDQQSTHLLGLNPNDCWKSLRLLGPDLTSQVWSIQEQSPQAPSGKYGGSLQVMQHMGLSRCGWQCPQAVTKQPRTMLRLSEKCGCASFNGWDRQESMWGQIESQSLTHMHRVTATQQQQTHTYNPTQTCITHSTPFPHNLFKDSATGFCSQWYTTDSILTQRSESCQKVTGNLPLG